MNLNFKQNTDQLINQEIDNIYNFEKVQRYDANKVNKCSNINANGKTDGITIVKFHFVQEENEVYRNINKCCGSELGRKYTRS